jgi:DNA polymerase-3 subunit delta'
MVLSKEANSRGKVATRKADLCSAIWSRLVGHREVIHYLDSVVSNRQVGQAYLFLGPSGVGKSICARLFAATLNCPKGGCGVCSICCRIEQDKHPDVKVIKPVGRELRLKQLREVCQQAFRKHFEVRFKIFIITEADRFNEEAANTFLKTLEEPPPNTIFILISQSLDNLLPTIISRCQIVRFGVLPEKEIAQFLVKKYAVSTTEADLAARLSSGSLGEACKFIESEAGKIRRAAAIKALLALREVDLAKIPFLAEDIINAIQVSLKGIKERQRQELKEAIKLAPSKELERIAVREIEEEHKRELYKEEFKAISDILQAIGAWYRDTLVIKSLNSLEEVKNIDQIESLKKEAKALTERQIEVCLEVVKEMQKSVKFNLNKQLAIEVLLFKLQEVVSADANSCRSYI